MSGRGAFPVMEQSSPTAERSLQPQQPQHLELMTVTFDKVKNSIGLSIIEAVVSCSRHFSVTVAKLYVLSVISVHIYLVVYSRLCLFHLWLRKVFKIASTEFMLLSVLISLMGIWHVITCYEHGTGT